LELVEEAAKRMHFVKKSKEKEMQKETIENIKESIELTDQTDEAEDWFMVIGP